MKQQKRKVGLFVAGITFLCMTIGVFASSLKTNLSNFKTSASGAKSVVDVTSTSITLSNNYSVAATTSGFTDGNLFSLANDGYIRNTEPIRGITSIYVTYGTGSGYAKIVPCYYDY